MAERSTTVDVVAPFIQGSATPRRFDPHSGVRSSVAEISISARAHASRFKFTPFLTIDGVRIPVAIAQPTHQETLIGQQRLTFSGRMRSGVRRRKRTFHIVTPLLPLGQAKELRRHLIRPPPLVAESAMFMVGDPVNVVIGPINGGYHRGGAVGGDDPLTQQTQLMSLEFDMVPE